MIKLPLSRPWGHVVAVAMFAVATAVRLALDPALGRFYPFSTYLITVVITAWACGVGPSVLVLALGSAAGLFHFIAPLHEVSASVNATGLCLFILVGLVVIADKSAEQRVVSRLEAEASRRILSERDAREWKDR
jgi:K+-sensing histidine kinase KdpD